MIHQRRSQHAENNTPAITAYNKYYETLIHFDSEEKPFTCQECSKSFSQSELYLIILIHQRRSQHAENNTPAITAYNKYYETLIHFDSEEKPFTCQECSKSFSQTELKTHLKPYSGEVV